MREGKAGAMHPTEVHRQRTSTRQPTVNTEHTTAHRTLARLTTNAAKG